MQSENVNLTLQDLPNFMRHITIFDSILTILWLEKKRKNKMLQYYTLPFTFLLVNANDSNLVLAKNKESTAHIQRKRNKSEKN